MTIDRPSAGNIVETVDELVVAVNAGNIPVGGTGVIAYTSVDTALGVTLSFDFLGIQVGTDHSLPEGQILFNVDQRAIVSLDFNAVPSNDATGFFQAVISGGGTSLPDLSYISWGNDRFTFPILNPGGGTYFNLTLPEDSFMAGNILNWHFEYSGPGTINFPTGSSMLYVLRTA